MFGRSLLFGALLVIFLLFDSILIAQEKQKNIFFEGNWHELLKTAQESKKPILLDFQTNWCGPCKWMERNVFADAEVIDYLDKRFIVYKVDAEKGQGIQLSEIYEPNGFPTYLCLTWNGDVLHKFSGSKKSKDFLDELDFGISTNRKTISQQDKLETFQLPVETKMSWSDDKLNNVEFLREYIQTNGQISPVESKIIDAFFDLLPEKERLNPENIEILVDFNPNFNSKTGKFLFENNSKFTYRNNRSLQGALINYYEDLVLANSLSEINSFIDLEKAFTMPSIYFLPKVRSQRTKLKFLEDTKDFELLKPAIKTYVEANLLNYNFSFLESSIDSTINNTADTLKAKAIEMWSERELLLKKGFIDDINEQLSYYALKYAELASAESDLEIALEWSKTSHLHINKAEFLFVTAQIYQLIGNQHNANKYAKKSLSIAEKNEESTLRITKFIEDYKK